MGGGQLAQGRRAITQGVKRGIEAQGEQIKGGKNRGQKQQLQARWALEARDRLDFVYVAFTEAVGIASCPFITIRIMMHLSGAGS